MEHRPFHYRTAQDVREELQELGVSIPLSEHTEVLRQPIAVGAHTLSNRLAIQPMEGCDSEPDGRPGELTRRRYHRFAESGAGLIWAEATAIVPEGRANPRQITLTEQTLDSFKALVEDVKETAQKETGVEPLFILQATHSGRYSKPTGTPAPLIAYHNPLFEQQTPIADDRIVSDEYLDTLPERYAATTRLAAAAGFDGVDIKACHRYLLSELLSAYDRPGRYGGDFVNRTRLYRDAIAAATAAAASDFLVATRLNLYDGFPHPYGWGVAAEGGLAPDMTEPIRLVEQLHTVYGVSLFDFTIGNPYVNPHVNRPYDHGGYVPPEHPLVGVARMCACIAAVKAHLPHAVVISSGHSYLRQFAALQAAGMVESGAADIAGFGREAFAYPAFARDLLQTGEMKAACCCMTCGKCTELMRAGSTAGCVLRDEVYLPIYRRDVLKK